MSASAAQQVESPPGGRPDVTAPETQARGLIVKTTTATPSDSLLAATDDALGAEAEVAQDDVLTKKISVVEFDEIVDAEVASDAAAEIEQRGDVEWAIPDRLLQPTAAPPISVNDTLFPSQTNLWNTAGAAGGYSIKAPSFWRKTTGSSDVTVAVLDTGILRDHPDLDGRVTNDGYDMVDNDSDPSDPGDWNAYGECGPRSPASNSSWHGTFVAGIIAANADNSSGIAGVAPGVKIRPVRVLGTCGGTTQTVIDGLRWASGGIGGAPQAAEVVNLSLTMQASSISERDRYCEVYNAYAAAGRARGSLFVAAAGNDYGNANLAVPAACSQFISVGATSNRGFSSSYSNIGSSVDLAAPGGDSAVEGTEDRIWSLDNAGQTDPGAFGYSRQQGTSMAAPEVSAAAALLSSLPELTAPAYVQKALYASVAPFRARSSSYARKRVQIGGDSYLLDLNCRGHAWCGRGILDLSRVEVPLSTRPAVQGPVIVGEPLTASLGAWVRIPKSRTYVWRVDGVQKATASVFYPSRADIGKTITVTVAPSNAAFARLSATSSATTAVPEGPAVTLAAPSSPTYGSAVKAVVTSSADGPVEIRTDSGAVVGTGTVVGGTATVTIAGKVLKPGAQRLRAAYVGAQPASSVRRSITVKKLQAKVSRTLRSRVKTTSRATLKVRVDETPNLFAGPSGKLRVYDGSRRIVTVNLNASDRGRKSIRLPRLKKGAHRIKVVYSGNAYIHEKSSSRRTIKAY